MIDIVAAAWALDMAAYSGPAVTVDVVSDADDPDLDGAHLLALLYGGRFDATLPQLLLGYTSTTVDDGWLRRGVVLIGTHGRAGVAVGKGYVVEPAADFYCLTPPEQDRWVAAYVPPGLTLTVQP